MTANSVFLRPQGLRPRARAPTCPPCYANPPQTRHCPIENSCLTPLLLAIKITNIQPYYQTFD